MMQLARSITDACRIGAAPRLPGLVILAQDGCRQDEFDAMHCQLAFPLPCLA